MITKRKPTNGQPREPQLTIPVEYGGVSIGEATARLGVRFSRPGITLETADRCFCGRRLSVEVELGQRDDAAGQAKIWDSDLIVAGSADCKRLGC